MKKKELPLCTFWLKYQLKPKTGQNNAVIEATGIAWKVWIFSLPSPDSTFIKNKNKHFTRGKLKTLMK